MKIRYAKKEDAKLLAKIGAETFWETYGGDSHLENEYIKAHIKLTFTERKIAAELETENVVYLIEESNGENAGYVRLVIKSDRDEISGKEPIEISRIYLRKEFWGKGFGKRLLQRCIDEALRNSCDVIWLSVWRHNPRAIKFYEKFGFYHVGEHIFDLAGSKQIDFLMQKDL